MDTVTMTSEEVCELLEISSKTLRNISSSKKLKEKFIAKGYTLINIEKCGRFNIYNLKHGTDYNWSIVQVKHNITGSRKKNHNIYSKTRLQHLDNNRKSVIKESKTNIAYRTAKKYDDILLEENIMEKNKFVYFLVDIPTDAFTEISEDEYKLFWIDNKELKRQLKSNKARRDKFEISEDAFDYLNYKTYDSFGKKEGVIAIKFMTYKQAKNTIKILNEISNSDMSQLLL